MKTESKKILGYILFLIALILIAVVISLLGGQDMENRVPIEEEPREEQDPEELNWETYENQDVGFSISYPSEMNVEEVDGGPEAISGAINISVWGPTQEPNTEFFDGITITIQKESMDELGASASAKNYAGLSFEHDKNMPITDSITELKEITVNEMTGYSYTVSSIGNQTHIFLDHVEGNMVLHIIYSAPDPTGQGFQETANQMLSTLELI